MTNKYTTFQEQFEEFVKLAQAGEQAKNGAVTPAIREMAAGLFKGAETADYKDYLLRNQAVQAAELSVVLNTGSEQKDAQVKVLEKDLEGLVEGMPDDEVRIGLQIVPPKQRYSGDNAEVYTKITKLGKKIGEMSGVLNAGDSEKMYTEVTKAEKSRLDSASKEQKALCKALVDAKGNFVAHQYASEAQATQNELTAALKDNEKGYLAANLKGKKFRDFYMQLMQAKQAGTPREG